MSSYIVIGSGFGGAISAKRLTEAGHDVTILEMGEDWSDPAKLEQNQDTKYLLRMIRDYPADYFLDMKNTDMVMTQGMGVGGGSLVYAGVHLRAPDSVFNTWPTGYSRASLDPFYDRVEARLGVTKPTDAFDYKKTQVMAQGALAAGLPAPEAAPLAVASDCTRCGWCVPICKFGKKNTMAHTYIADAQATGRLTIITHAKVDYVAKKNGNYAAVFWKTDGVDDNYHLVNSGAQYVVEADGLVISAGAIESPCILERSLEKSLPSGYSRINNFNTAKLGKEIDGTGDIAGGGFVPQTVETFKGQIIMSAIDMGDYVIEDLHGIPAGASVKYEAAMHLDGEWRTWGLAYKQKWKDYGQHMLGMAAIGKSPSGAVTSVNSVNGNAKLSGGSFLPPVGSTEAMESIITSLGGDVAKTPWDRFGMSFSAHPVGGCAMEHVVDSWNMQVMNNPDLYVIDGSVLPGSPFRNPSNTIAAIAEKAMDVILEVPGAPAW